MVNIISIENFILLAKTTSTAKSWRISLKQFFTFMKTTPENYLSQAHEYENDVILFARYLEREQHLAPKSIRSYTSGVVKYLKKNGIKMSDDFWSTELGVVNEPITNDKAPTNDELRSILTHTDACGKALFLLESSSGVRIEDALLLKLETVRKVLGEHPPMLVIIQKKTRHKQLVFFSQESVDAIQEWLKVRDEYLSTAFYQCSSRGIGEVDIENDKLFPFQYSKAVTMWNSACDSAGFSKKDENTGRRELHLHSLRKFFRTNCGRAGIEPDLCEALVGHRSGLERIYARYSQDEIKKIYLIAEEKLRVFVEPVVDEATALELGMLKARLEQQQKLIQQLNQGMRNLAITHQDPMVRKLWEHELGQ